MQSAVYGTSLFSDTFRLLAISVFKIPFLLVDGEINPHNNNQDAVGG